MTLGELKKADCRRRGRDGGGERDHRTALGNGSSKCGIIHVNNRRTEMTSGEKKATLFSLLDN